MSAFRYGRQPTREEVYLYDRRDPNAARGRSSLWLVRTNSRHMLVRAQLTGPELDVKFDVATPNGDVPFEGHDLLMARDWAPLDENRPAERLRLVQGCELRVDGVVQPAYVAVKGPDTAWSHYGWTYVRVRGALQICGTMWLHGKDVEGTLDYLAECVETGARAEFGVDLKAEAVR